MAKVKILTSAALYFIAFWTLGVDLMMIRLPPRGFKDKTPVGSITMNNHALLDMAPNSIDDYYKGCRPKMKKMVKKEYLVQERQNNDAFNQAWASAEDYYQKKKVRLGNLSKNNFIAIHVYVSASHNIYRSFNAATRTQGKSYKTFNYHSLHFFLTDAVRKLNTKDLPTTFRGTNIRFNVTSATIRFGQFTSSSKNQSIAKGFGDTSCFEIDSYFGASIEKYSYLDEKEVLIPPYEVFQLTSVKLKKLTPDLWCDVVYKLKSTKVYKSNLNCQMMNQTKSLSAFSQIHYVM